MWPSLWKITFANVSLGQHLGQGANQSFEDIEVLVQALEKCNPTAKPPSTEVLKTVFHELESIRISRSSSMVQQARAQGEYLVAEGLDEGKARNNLLREKFHVSGSAGLSWRFGMVE